MIKRVTYLSVIKYIRNGKYYPIQHCQFHQMMIRHYLTGNPDIEASKKLLSLVNSMTKMNKESFIEIFDLFYL